MIASCERESCAIRRHFGVKRPGSQNNSLDAGKKKGVNDYVLGVEPVAEF